MELTVGVDRVRYFNNTNHADKEAFQTLYDSYNINVIPDYVKAKIGGQWLLLARATTIGTADNQWVTRSILDGSGATVVSSLSRQLITDAITGTKTTDFTVSAGAAQINFEVLAGSVTVSGIVYSPTTITGELISGNGDLLPEIIFDLAPSSSVALRVMRYA